MSNALQRQDPVRALREQDDQGFVQGLWKAVQITLPQHTKDNQERWMRLCVGALRRNERLRDVATRNPLSLIGGVMECAALGLEPNSPLAQAHLIPFGSEIQVVIGYAGLIELAARAGVTVFDPHPVWSGDLFEWDDSCVGKECRVHKPYWTQGNDKGDLLATWVGAKSSTGESKHTAMPREDINAIHDDKFAQWQRMRRKWNKTDKYEHWDGPWRTHFVAMALKSVVRRATKWVPKSAESRILQRALSVDGSTVAGVSGEAALLVQDTEAVTADGEVVGLSDEEKAAIEAEEAEQAELDRQAAKDEG